jgi:mercuric ion transport protein
MATTEVFEKPMSSFAHVMRVLFVIVAYLLALCILIQVFLAGLSIFASPTFWMFHTTFVQYFEFLPLLLIIFALFGRTRHALVWLSLLLLVQIGLQYAFAALPIGVVAALHPVNAVMMFWLTMYVARRALKLLKQEEDQKRETRA